MRYRFFCILFFCFGMAGCLGPVDLQEPVEPIGDFALGYAVVVGPDMVKGPMSRDGDPEQIIASVKNSIETHLDPLSGGQLFHVAVKIEGYVLAKAGVPLLVSPQSALILSVTIWRDETGQKLNPVPHQITVLEAPSERTLIGSGLAQSSEQQLENLARSAALQIEAWLRTQHIAEGWF